MTLEDLNLGADALRALYAIQLQQIESVERQACLALPILASGLTSLDARNELLLNAGRTELHLRRLHEIAADLAQVSDPLVCGPMRALVASGEELHLIHPPGGVRDGLLIAVVKEIKHLGIAKYTMAMSYAAALGYSRHWATLKAIKEEELDADWNLTFLIENVRPALPDPLS